MTGIHLEPIHWLLVGISAAVAATLCGLIVYFRLNKPLQQAREQIKTLEVTLELERSNANEKLQTLENAKQQLQDSFSALSSQALQKNNEAFLKLAQENLKQFQIQAKNELGQKEKSIENLIKPIKEALDKTEKQIREIENERKEAYGALTQHLTSMAQTQSALQSETRNLVKALSRPEVRGQWGELTLKRLAELAGMVEHCDFFQQEHQNTEHGALRPDMIVRMPGQREIVVDVKTPLDAYLSAVEADNDTDRSKALERHCRNVRKRIQELSAKSYWNQFKNSPEFVVLFIPGDQFLSAALDLDHQLLEDAMQQKVILATPTSLMALLRAIAYGWRQESLAENAEHIREIGADLYQRLATFAEHLGRLGKSLSGSVQHFNRAVASFDSRIIPGARKFTEMGISEKKPLERVEQIEAAPKALESSPETVQPEEKQLEDA
ncbi:MAG: DNA recombination protein RmuC [Gammaproteobacteria bacterium]|nr:DNA recombination protein RmuC [Gammaproteobacteria bacterium]MDH5801259.1 DNA recombination protein RmuC [Gammaproteobacteria bacterium]